MLFLIKLDTSILTTFRKHRWIDCRKHLRLQGQVLIFSETSHVFGNYLLIFRYYLLLQSWKASIVFFFFSIGIFWLKPCSKYLAICMMTWIFLYLMYCSIWFYFGLLQLAYARCYPWIDDFLELESNKEAFSASINSWRRTCLFAARHAKFSYQRALHLSPWQANIYADIAVTSNLINSLDKSYKQDINARYILCNQIILNDLDYSAPLPST